jgi:hypothetical protein
MRKNILLLIGAAFLVLCLSQSSVEAQYVTVSSSLSYDSAARKVNGVSQTSMDYWTTYYYRARTKGYIYTQNPGSPLASSEALGNFDQSVVTVTTQVSTSPWVDYKLRTEHFVLPRVVSFGQYYDYWNYYYVSPAWTGVSDLGASRTIYGCQQYQPYPYTGCYADIVYDWIWLGNTNTTIRTPPLITLSNQFVTGSLNGTTQNVLLGSPGGIQATVTPSGLNGSYVWAITGPFAMDFTSNDNSFRSIFWTEPGTNTVSVTYAGTGFSVKADITVQVRVPTLTSFQGNLGRNVVDRGSNCSALFSGQFPPLGATYSLECYQSGGQKRGMTWTATASIPDVQYMSDLSDAGIQFKQIVSVFRKRMNNGRLECFTTRNPQSDPNTGWNLDGSDPYRLEVPLFAFGKTITAPYPIPPEFDAPAAALAGRGNTTGAPFEFDSYLIDDRFETYVYYFTGSAGQPEFTRPLHIADSSCPADRFDCGVDRLVWQWGGTVNFDSTVANILYRETTSTTNTGAIAATRTPTPRSYDPHRIQDFGYSLCQGAPNTTNPIDGSRFFLRQLYLGILNREPDPGGWDYWLSAIAQCNVDTACIYSPTGRRHWIVTRFLVSPETFTRFPGLANPPGSPGFDPNVYNPAYINACFVGLLNRSPDADGYAYYMNILNQTGDYDRVLNGFLESAEFRARFGPAEPHY